MSSPSSSSLILFTGVATFVYVGYCILVCRLFSPTTITVFSNSGGDQTNPPRVLRGSRRNRRRSFILALERLDLRIGLGPNRCRLEVNMCIFMDLEADFTPTRFVVGFRPANSYRDLTVLVPPPLHTLGPFCFLEFLVYLPELAMARVSFCQVTKLHRGSATAVEPPSTQGGSEVKAYFNTQDLVISSWKYEYDGSMLWNSLMHNFKSIL